MKAEAILQSDVLDIIFDNRNKSYGAYSLRKYYNNRVYKALGLTFLIATGFYALTFINIKKNKTLTVGPDIIMARAPQIVQKAPKPKEPSKPKEAVVAPKVNTQAFVNNLSIVKDEMKVPVIATLTDKVVISNVTEIGQNPGVKAVVQGGEVAGNGKVVTTDATKIDKVTPIETAEVMPAYPGGMDALRKFLQKNLHNPQDLDEGQIVSVKIKFIVGYDGNLKGFQTVEDGGAAFNNEVIRVLKKMPDWIPGKSKGENVSVYFTIPVKFVSE